MTKEQKRFILGNRVLLQEAIVAEIDRLRHLKEGRDSVESGVRDILVLITPEKDLVNVTYLLIPDIELVYFSWQTHSFLDVTIAKRNPIKNPLKIKVLVLPPEVDAYVDRLGFLHNLKGPAINFAVNNMSANLFLYHGALVDNKKLWGEFSATTRLRYVDNWFQGDLIRESLL